MLIAGVMLVLLGAAIWYWSRRGMAVGHHPTCRACGFDLYMLPEDSKRCPECGAYVLTDDAIRIGHRRPLRWGMALGAVGLLSGTVMVGLEGVAWWGQFDGSRYKTVGMLEGELRSPKVRVRTRAGAELERRIGARTLSGAQVERLAQETLKRQADPHWEPLWGDLLQVSHTTPRAGETPLLAENLWERFLRQGMEIAARVRPRVRSGDPVPIAVTCRLNVGTKWLSPGMTFVPQITVSFRGAGGRITGREQACDFPVPMEWTACWQPESALALGTQDVKVAVTMTAQDGRSAVARTTAFTLPVEVLDRDSPSVVRRKPTAEERREFEAAMQWRLNETEDATISLAEGTLGKLWVAAPPVAAAFRVVLRQGTGEWLIGRFMAPPDGAANVPLPLPPAGVSPGEARIVCIPDDALAVGTVDVLEIWGEEIVRKVTLSP